MALAFVPFDNFLGDIGSGAIDLDSDDFYAVLTNTTPDVNDDEDLEDIVQIASGNGYTTDGVLLTGVTWTEYANGKWMFDSADFQWENDGSSAMDEFRYVVIYSAENDRLCGYYDYGSGITLPVGTIFQVQPGANGHFRIGVGTIS
jgi:hypothetical protein